MTGGQWYYSADGVEQHAISLEALKTMLAAGSLPWTALVWTDGLEEWTQARNVAALAATRPPIVTSAPSYQVPPVVTAAAAYQAPPQVFSSYISYAGFTKRFFAAFIDGFVLLILNFVVEVCVGMCLGFSHTAGGGTMDTLDVSGVESSPLLFIAGILVSWFYFAGMESSAKQATLGKQALGIIVTDSQGHAVSFGRASVRHFSKILSFVVLMVGFLMAGLTERKQALHDMVADCLVVDKH